MLILGLFLISCMNRTEKALYRSIEELGKTLSKVECSHKKFYENQTKTSCFLMAEDNIEITLLGFPSGDIASQVFSNKHRDELSNQNHVSQFILGSTWYVIKGDPKNIESIGKVSDAIQESF